ncbi:GNAT family N-acetyltransferase [Poriferisphaera corsica]|nr:GNAT family N-acetyltransferase [Poriferisphaera corsica]
MTKIDSESINIRLYQPQDADALAGILVGAFRGKFQRLANLDEPSMRQMLLDAGFVGPHGHPGLWVAEKDNTVLAAMSLKWQQQKRGSEGSLRGILRVCLRHGFTRIGRFMIGMWLLEEQIQKQDCYIEYLAVSESAQGLGLGTQLLKKAQTEASALRAQLGFERISLHVAGGNTGAQRLYQRFGFTVERTIQSHLSRRILGESIWHFMSKSLD